jgi:hypothetical protein
MKQEEKESRRRKMQRGKEERSTRELNRTGIECNNAVNIKINGL